jgi:hypothetical protein
MYIYIYICNNNKTKTYKILIRLRHIIYKNINNGCAHIYSDYHHRPWTVDIRLLLIKHLRWPTPGGKAQKWGP